MRAAVLSVCGTAPTVADLPAPEPAAGAGLGAGHRRPDHPAGRALRERHLLLRGARTSLRTRGSGRRHARRRYRRVVSHHGRDAARGRQHGAGGGGGRGRRGGAAGRGRSRARRRAGHLGAGRLVGAGRHRRPGRRGAGAGARRGRRGRPGGDPARPAARRPPGGRRVPLGGGAGPGPPARRGRGGRRWPTPTTWVPSPPGSPQPWTARWTWSSIRCSASRRRPRCAPCGPAAGWSTWAARPANTAPIDSATLRGGSLRILGYTNNALSPADRSAAVARIAAHAAAGELTVAHETVPLADVAHAWTRQATGAATGRLVLVP